MKFIKAAGIALIALGVIGLIYGSISHTPADKVVNVDSIKEHV